MQADATLIKAAQHGAMSETYLTSATRMFLEGSGFQTPVDAVLAGARSLREWCECLQYARFLYMDAKPHGFDDDTDENLTTA